MDWIGILIFFAILYLAYRIGGLYNLLAKWYADWEEFYDINQPNNEEKSGT